MGAESEALEAALTGTLVSPGSAEYNAACRSSFNATSFDVRPAGFIFCENINDVVHAVNFARKNHPHIVVRSNGHTNRSVAEAALVLDLSRMKSIRVWNAKKLAVVQPGVNFGELNEATMKFGLAVPGPAPSSGVASAALCGGKGLLTRQYGLTLDQLLEVEIVTTDGKVEKASANHNSKLFWAIRGGSGFVGVVTQFLFKLEPVHAPSVLAGHLVFPVEWAKEILHANRVFEAWQQVRESLPAEASVSLSLCTPPPELRGDMNQRPVHRYGWGSKITKQDNYWHGKYAHPCLVFTVFYNGGLDEISTTVFDPLVALQPAVNTIGEMSYSEATALNEFNEPWGERYHYEGGVLKELTQEVLTAAITAVRHHAHLTIEFGDYVGGAVDMVDTHAMAYPHRSSNVEIKMRSRWTNKEDDDAAMASVSELHNSLAQAGHLTGCCEAGSYPGDLDEEAAFGAGNTARLLSLRREYDPAMMLMANHL